MADIFISYSKQDRHMAQALADELRLRGYDVWWDNDLYAGDSFHNVIRVEIANARAVVVIWSEHAIISRWVLGEAQEAYDLNKIIATHVPTFDIRKVPLNFRTLHMEDVEDHERVVRALKHKGIMNTLTELEALKLAANSGNRDAQVKLGITYAAGQTVPRDYTEAARLFRLAAEQGDIDAQVNLGLFYMDGCGVSKNHFEAACLFQRAAEQGDAEALVYLSIHYNAGLGVAQDGKFSLKLAQLAAGQGHPHGQFILGMMYRDAPKFYGEEGTSEEENLEEGLRLLMLAADQGHYIAWNELKSIHRWLSSGSPSKARLEKYSADPVYSAPRTFRNARRYGGGYPWLPGPIWVLAE